MNKPDYLRWIKLLAIGLILQAPLVQADKSASVIIKKIGTSNCYHPGDALEVMGKGFGNPSATRHLVLQENSQRQVIDNIKAWSDSRISAQLPRELNKPQGQSYLLGIVEGSRWLTNQDHKITLCSSTKNRIPSSYKLPETAPSATDLPDSKTENDTTENSPPPDKMPVRATTRTSPFAQTHPQQRQAVLSAPALPASTQIVAPPSEQGAVASEPQEVIVVTTSREQAQALEQFVRQYAISVKRRNSYADLGMVVSVLRIPAEYASADVIQQLRESYPEFPVDLNHRYQLLASNSGSIGDSKHWAYDTLQWTSVIRDCPVRNRLGIIDTGIASIDSLDHSKIHAKSMLSQGIKAASQDHGTAVASLLLGSVDRNIPGLLPTTALYSAAIFRLREDHYTDTTAELILKGLNWLAEQQVAVINMSFGGPQNRALEIAIQRLLEKGIVIVAAAGSGANAEALYPAALPGVIAVTAIDARLQALTPTVAGDYVDFSAPGVDLWLLNAQDKGRYLSGSSFATPIVAAAYTVLNLDSKTYTSLKQAARDLGEPGRDQTFGWGLLQIHPLCQH